ncbi:UDP-glucuronosyl/UDP-glucosyltransferase [Corchorus capsularis]|uniref:Glycosyltransferase n=1 Tax=Corchorus capsularis TaxID=210143 RepID=A0A1R3G154_COCAP|nr:UDP-glucuronosyl/UDP-glucosyltransferase [Corchorus capsularis]
MPRPHFLLVSYAAQGHINPTLQFAKCLIRIGAHVTFTTSLSARRRMTEVPKAEGLSFVTFSDGYDDGLKPNDDREKYGAEFKRRGTENLNNLIASSNEEGKPITCIVYSLLITWAMEVAREHQIPCAILWIQPASVFDIYYFYFNGYEETIKRQAEGEPKCLIKLPGLPPLANRDLPSFVGNQSAYPAAINFFQKQFELIAQETNPKILVNTFDALEPEALNAIEKFKMIAVGPLIPSSFLGRGTDPLDGSLKADLFQGSKDYVQWLGSKPNSSVIYISFGSIAALAKQQVEEIARALLAGGRPFLWVLRNQKLNGVIETEQDKLSCKEELEQVGMIVPWCSQLEVLSHPSLGCFVTHCGWNSTLESLASGVPLVAFPQWTDQPTNAKLIEDVWGNGVRVRGNEEGIVERDEINRCLDLVMGDEERAKEVRRNAQKWKDLAREAAKEGGSLDRNLKSFIDDLAHKD